jgi:Acyl-CoA carboxylase epsilon subunit
VSGETQAHPPLFLIKGQAIAEEVAALTVVLHSVAAASAPAEEPEVTSEWSAHRRKLRTNHPVGPGGWRASGLPR